MDRITVDDSVKSTLFSSGEPLILCDTSGSAFGHFVPIVAPQSKDDCPYSADELTAMRLESGGQPLADLWKSLGVQAGTSPA
jgi:hypothetical protein